MYTVVCNTMSPYRTMKFAQPHFICVISMGMICRSSFKVFTFFRKLSHRKIRVSQMQWLCGFQSLTCRFYLTVRREFFGPGVHKYEIFYLIRSSVRIVLQLGEIHIETRVKSLVQIFFRIFFSIVDIFRHFKNRYNRI